MEIRGCAQCSSDFVHHSDVPNDRDAPKVLPAKLQHNYRHTPRRARLFLRVFHKFRGNWSIEISTACKTILNCVIYLPSVLLVLLPVISKVWFCAAHSSPADEELALTLNPCGGWRALAPACALLVLGGMEPPAENNPWRGLFVDKTPPEDSTVAA
ncbi:hypothetical protein MVEN_01471400 [Mycena venus]|uniref:Uncharacterized protein n=1 Tax=Mycena venus TaxID=2733690 RepID=A0A8H7CR48_9AGAR|nr:hypothetical protein MVEN_01471400 [Mycena venus]